MTRITLALLVALGLAACETTEGFIRDSQNAGSAVGDALN